MRRTPHHDIDSGIAYDDRWGRMSTWDFFKRRLIRLQPMVILGSLIGAFWFYFSAAPGFELVMQTPWWKLLLIMVLGYIMFPTPPSMDIRGWKEINSLNGQQLSLLWEYIANIMYALFVRRFSKVVLAALVFLSALLTIDLAMNLDVFGLLEVRDYAKYTVIGGFGLTPDQIYIGVCRLLYPFFGGLLLYRLGKWRINLRHGGMISYPLYITHYPMIYVQMNWAARHADAPLRRQSLTASILLRHFSLFRSES